MLTYVWQSSGDQLWEINRRLPARESQEGNGAGSACFPFPLPWSSIANKKRKSSVGVNFILAYSLFLAETKEVRLVPRGRSIRSLEVFVEPGDGAADGVDLVFAFFEAVAFVGVVVRVNGLAVLLEEFDDLLGFFLGDAGIIAALQNEERRLDVVDVGDGRGGVVDGAIFHGIAEKALLVLLEHGIGVLQHGHPINDAVELDGSGPHIGRFADAHESHETAIGAASNADFFRIDVAGSFEKFCREHFILKIAAAEILEVGFLKIDAVAGGAADIGFNADIPAGDECGYAWAPIVGRLSSGAAVRQNQRRIGLIAFEVEGNPKQRADGFSVERFVADDVRRGARRGTQAGDGGKS